MAQEYQNNASVIAAFRDHKLAQQAVNELQAQGWSLEELQIIYKPHEGTFSNFKKTLTKTEDKNVDNQEWNELDQFDLPEEQRQAYRHALETGSALVIARSRNQQLEARDVLHRFGAYQVFTPFTMGESRTIPIRKEQAQIQKHVVDIGEVRIYKRVITEQQTFTVPVTREEIHIERIPYAPQAAQGLERQPVHDQLPVAEHLATPTGQPQPYPEILTQEGSVRIVLKAEQVEIIKHPVITEEIVVHKNVVEETRHIVEPLKHEEVRVDTQGKVPIRENTPSLANNSGPIQ